MTAQKYKIILHFINEISNFVRDLENKNTNIMNSILKKVLTYLVFPVVIVGLTYWIVKSVSAPVEFNKMKDYRTSVAVQRLKDVRDLQVAFKNVNGRYTADIDTLINFYKEGKMKIVMQVGSQDDSLAVENTKKLKKRNPRIKPEQMLELYQKGERLVFKIEALTISSELILMQKERIRDVIQDFRSEVFQLLTITPETGSSTSEYKSERNDING